MKAARGFINLSKMSRGTSLYQRTVHWKIAMRESYNESRPTKYRTRDNERINGIRLVKASIG